MQIHFVMGQSSKDLTEEQKIELDRNYIGGTQQKMLQNLDDAVLLFLKCLQTDPSIAAVHYQLADVYYMKRMYVDAEKYINNAIKLDKNNIWFFKLQADIYESQRKYAKAAEVYIYLSNQENEVQYLLRSAYFFLLVKDYKKALGVLNKAENVIGVNEEIIQQKEQIYLSTNKLGKALDEVKKLIKANPGVTKYEGMLAELYMMNKQESKALEIYFAILKREPNNGFAAFALSDYYQTQKDFEQWYLYLKKGISSDDVEVKSKLRMLVPFVSDKFFDNQDERNMEMVNLFAKAHPNEATAFIIRGDLLIQKDLFVDAREEYYKGLAIEPGAFAAWQQVVFCNTSLNDQEAMQKDCIKAIEYFPNEPLFYYYASYASYRLKDYDAAITHATNGVAITVDNDEMKEQFYSMMADAAHYARKHELTDSIYELVLQKNPNNAYALNNYAYFLSLRKAKLDKAEKMSAKSLEIEPNSASYMDTYGWILFQQSKYIEAEKWIAKALAISSESGEVLEHMGDVQFKLNKPDEALKYWKKAKDAGKESLILERKIAEKTWYE